MEQSILDSVKKVLGLAPDYEHFDQDVIMHINSVFSTLSQLGVGPVEGFMIEDKTATWEAFLAGDNNYNSVKTYMCLRVRMLFDPPATSFHITAIQEQLKELEYRISTHREGMSWTEPIRPPVEPIL